jgi:replication factor A1
MSTESEPVEATVAQLKPRMKSVTITFKVVEIGEEREVSSRDSGETHRVVDAVVGDSTGTVQVPLWDDAIETMKPGDTYTLTNGYTGLFRGNLRLNIGKFGKVEKAKTAIDEVNKSVDMSAEEHEDTRPPRRSYDDSRGSSRGGYSGGGGGGYRGGRREGGYDSSRNTGWFYGSSGSHSLKAGALKRR